MLVSDGDKKRLMRKKAISPVVKGIGAAYFDHPTENSFGVVCFVEGFRDKTD
jgi:hypothetical protein